MEQFQQLFYDLDITLAIDHRLSHNTEITWHSGGFHQFIMPSTNFCFTTFIMYPRKYLSQTKISTFALCLGCWSTSGNLIYTNFLSTAMLHYLESHDVWIMYVKCWNNAYLPICANSCQKCIRLPPPSFYELGCPPSLFRIASQALCSENGT